ncbi:hypothetical protein ACQP2P_15370 [Dactylosporangium sp. CA-139114]|uniref:hypothetical protein n=1 Tax=Dactylosporangium sp. CA-139114 TaxID=3239931 RepID=UPI003D9861D2
MISMKTQLVIAGALLVAGMGGWVAQSASGPSRLTAAQIGSAVGCATVDKLPNDRGALETAACPLPAHHRATIVTFDGGRQRDEWLQAKQTEWTVSSGAAAVVKGDGWAVLTDDLAAADRLAAKTGGWWA